ncbi:MAG: cohesin domain-containing protein [Bryobacteraceae bacterium]
MIVGNSLRALAWVSLAFLITPSSDLLARNRKGDKFLKLARDAEARKDYDTALDYYNQAMSQDPANPSYELGMRRVRFQAGENHVRAGQKLRDSGKLDEALVEFQKAFATDPSSPIALQEMKRTMEMIGRNKAGNTPPDQANLTPADLERQKAQDRIATLSPVPQLKPITEQISHLQMNNQPPKVLYETVGKVAGINVVFDPQYQFNGKNVNLDLTNSTLEDALDYIAMQTKTFWKPISANTIFVAEDNVTKRRDYEDQVVKVFYLKNVTSVQEFQEIVTAVRSITDIRRMFPYNAQNAVMCRGSVDQIALAEKLFHDLDKAKAEVVVDLIVMEANRDKTRDYAAGLVSGSKTGLVIPVGFTPRGGTTTTPTPTPAPPANPGNVNIPSVPASNPSTNGTGAISISQIGKVSFSDFSLTLPGALLQAVMSDNQTHVLQSPQVRASDGQKVTLRIGDKVPYATGSFQPGIGTVGVSPLVSTQFQFAEVGVNVDITPHVHGSDELTLHVAIEISNVSSHVSIGGLDQPVISQRKSEAEIRLRDGEVSLLGGLMQGQTSNSVSGIPGLVNVPVLGKLIFGSSSKDVSRGELLIALIPHIVRSSSITPLDMREVSAGTEANVKMMYQRPEASPSAAAPAATPATPAIPAAAAATAAALSPAGPPVLTFAPSSVQVPLSGPVAVTLQAQNMTDLVTAPFHVKWDPKLLRLNQVTPGTLIGDGGPQANPPSVDIRNDSGEAFITISRVTGAPGVNGSGDLAKLTFMAVGKGTGSIAVTDANLRNSKQEPISASGPTMPVTVQ